MGTFSAKMVYKRVRGWISGRSLPVLNFVKYPAPSGDQSNFSVALIFVSFEEKGFHRVVLVEQLSFWLPLVLRVQPPYGRLIGLSSYKNVLAIWGHWRQKLPLQGTCYLMSEVLGRRLSSAGQQVSKDSQRSGTLSPSLLQIKPRSTQPSKVTLRQLKYCAVHACFYVLTVR